MRMRRLSRGGDVRSRKDRKQARHSAVLTEAASSSSSSDADIKARFEKAAKYKARKGQKEDKSGDVNETMLPTAVDATTAKPGPTSEGGAVEYEQVKKTDEFDSLAPEIQTALRKKGAVQVAVETGSAVPESRRPGENEEVWEIASEIANERGIAVHSVPFEEVQQRMSTASVTDPRLQESALEATYKRGVADQLVEEKVEQAERAVAGGAEVSSLDAASSGASASVFDPTVLSVERIEELTPMQQSASTPGAVDTSSNAAADSLSAELQSYRQRKGAEVDTQTEQAAAALVAEGNQLLDAGRFQRARDVLRKACAICPGKVETGAQARLSLGVTLDALGYREEALEAYEGACQAKGQTARKASRLIDSAARAEPFMNADAFDHTVGRDEYRSLFDSLADKDAPYLPTEEEKKRDERNALVQSVVSLLFLIGAPVAWLTGLKLLAATR